MLPRGHLELLDVDAFGRHGAGNGLPVAEEQPRLARDQPAEERDVAAPASDRDVHDRERARGDDPAGQRGVPADHRVLHRVRDHEDDDEIERRHLPQLAFAREAEKDEHGDIHDERPQQDLVPRRRHVEEIHGVSPRARACR